MKASENQIQDQQRDIWDRFAAGWRAWDATVSRWLAPVGQAMIADAALGDRSVVLDVATGTGEPGLSAAAMLPQGRVTLTDLAERMLAVASDNAAQRGIRNVETRVCAADALPFGDGSFDAGLCRFGFMFFPDVPTAARELVRVTRPGGRVSTAVWAAPQKNPWATIIMGTIARHVPAATASPSAPGLFRCAGDGYLREVLAAAGLKDIVVHEVPCPMTHDSPQRYWEFMTDVAAPVVAGLSMADKPTRDLIHDEVLDLARRYVRDGRVEIHAAATVATGTK